MIPGERDMERILLLKQVPLFRYLPLDTLLAVGRVLESRRYRAGQEVVGEGARLDHLHIVESGAVAIARRHRSERLAAPACFGEAALVGEVPSFRRVVALEDVTLIRLHRVIFEDLSRDHPEIATELSRLLARRLRQLEGGGQAGAAP